MTVDAIRVESLSKAYRLGADIAFSETLFQQLGALAMRPLQRLRGVTQPVGPALFTALDDVSFKVVEGQTVGIIGHNGAGKSTLLKILSRITEPTSGRVGVRGRMASLLEVGTGFHPNLSGRDNVFLNGAILGMSRHDVRARFDDIVAFAQLEKFIDTPIKHYSSGMRVRLAFAVAAHLEPDIMIIDEVLAVGDAAFQKRCLQRIEEVGQSGRTVLFVSHQLNTVSRLCGRTLVLDHGRLVFDGATGSAIHHYYAELGGARSRRVWSRKDTPTQANGPGPVWLRAVEIMQQGRGLDGPVDVRLPIEVVMDYEVAAAPSPVIPCMQLLDGGGDWVFIALDPEASESPPRPPGQYRVTATIPQNLLNEGFYGVSLSFGDDEAFYKYGFAHECAHFSVADPLEGGSTRLNYGAEMPGVIRPALDWHVEERRCGD